MLLRDFLHTAHQPFIKKVKEAQHTDNHLRIQQEQLRTSQPKKRTCHDLSRSAKFQARCNVWHIHAFSGLQFSTTSDFHLHRWHMQFLKYRSLSKQECKGTGFSGQYQQRSRNHLQKSSEIKTNSITILETTIPSTLPKSSRFCIFRTAKYQWPTARAHGH